MAEEERLNKECWAGIDPDSGEVCHVASIDHYAFADAVKLMEPCEVRRMTVRDSEASFKRYFKKEGR